MKPLNIIIADDNNTFRQGLRFFLENIQNHKVTAEANNGIELLNISKIQYADILLVDIEMPEMDGITAIKKVLFHNHHLKTIAITGYQDSTYLVELINAGFKGCVFKKNIFEELMPAIKNIMAGKTYFPSNISLMNKEVQIIATPIL